MNKDKLSPDHRDFYDRFCSFWAAPSGQRVPELIAPEATIHFTGIGTLSGTEYVEAMAAVLASMPDAVVTPIDCAGSGDLLYIFWNTTATVNGASRTWNGVDRFRLKDGMAIEEHVIFDSAVLPVQEAAAA